MPFCRFADSAAMYDVTPIENMFLLEYLPTAPDGFLRVYLYARMLCLHPELGGGIDEVAGALHMDADAVFNAMSYWERQGIVRRLSDRPPTYVLVPMRGAGASDPMESDYYEYREFNAALQSLFGPDNLLHPKQYEMANDWLNLLGFTQSAVLKMVENKLRRSRSKKPDAARLFKQLNEQAAKWAERGVRTDEDVERALKYDERIEKTAAAVLKQFSISRPATLEELKLVERWLNDWNFTLEQIIDACAETTKSRTPTLAYLNSVLDSRRRGEGEQFEGVKKVLRELGSRDAQPTPDQLQSYASMLAAGFEPATILLAAAQCSRKGKRRFEELEWMIGKWSEMKLFRRDQAEAYVADRSRVTAEVRQVLEACGSDKRPQMDDISMYESWRAAHSQEIVLYAAQCARGMQLPMRYIDRLLAEWAKEGVKTVDDARARHESYRSGRASEAVQANPALQYEQRAHTDEDYGNLLINLDEDYGNGGGQA